MKRTDWNETVTSDFALELAVRARQEGGKWRATVDGMPVEAAGATSAEAFRNVVVAALGYVAERIENESIKATPGWQEFSFKRDAS